MVKIIVISLVLIVIFTSSLYLGIFELLGTQIATFNSDFISFIPLELRLAFFMIILWIGIGTAKALMN